MEQMQQVLTVGVDAFAQQLPQSVDGTLVQFDAVLAEGVHHGSMALSSVCVKQWMI